MGLMGGCRLCWGANRGGPLLTGCAVEARGPALMRHIGHVVPRGPLKAPRTVEPDGAIEAQGPLLLEAHRTRSHAAETTGGLKVTWPPRLALIPHGGLLANGATKPAWPLRGRVEPPHSSHEEVTLHGALEPLGDAVMRRSPAVEPAGAR